MTAIPGSVRVAGFIAPTDSTDTYAVHDDAYGRGGWRTVANITERNAISADRRKIGMEVRVLDDGGTQKFYTLSGGIEDNNWVEDFFGSGGSIDSDITYYVDGDNGSDAYTGLSWGSAKKTMSFLYSGDGYAIPREINADVTIRCRGTILSTNTTSHTIIDGLYGSGTFTIEGETEDVITLQVPTGWDNTVTSTTYHSYLEISEATYAIDAYKGMFVQFTSPVSDTKYPILSNTATKIETIGLPELTGVEQFKIVKNSAIWKGATVANPGSLILYSGVTFGISDVKIISSIKNINLTNDLFYIDGTAYIWISNCSSSSLIGSSVSSYYPYSTNTTITSCFFGKTSSVLDAHIVWVNFCYSVLTLCVFENMVLHEEGGIILSNSASCYCTDCR